MSVVGVTEPNDPNFLSEFFRREIWNRSGPFFSQLETLALSPGWTVLIELGSRWDCGKMPSLSRWCPTSTSGHDKPL